VSVQRFTPNAVLTITYDAKSSDTLDDAKRFIRKVAKTIGQHIFCEFHYGPQHQRRAKYNENKNHFHIVCSFEYPEYQPLEDELFLWVFEQKISTVKGMRVSVKPYTWSPKEVRYFFLKHEGHYGPYVACPGKGRCRRKGCPYKNGVIDWKLVRPVF
jgi:hypothetical protein